MGWIIDAFTQFKETILILLDQLLLLPDRLDSIKFDENFIITRFLALIHYILGTPLYLMFCLVLLIGAGFILYRIAKTLLHILQLMFPKLKGKFILP